MTKRTMFHLLRFTGFVLVIQPDMKLAIHFGFSPQEESWLTSLHVGSMSKSSSESITALKQM